ncbi:TonB-dependent receptor, partial [bacterium]
MIRMQFLLAILIAVCVSTASSQTTTGNLEGRILDDQNEPIPGVSVSVVGPSLQGQRGVSTTETGFFRLLALPSGMYTVSLSHISYQRAEMREVHISLGKTTQLGEVRLTQKTVQMNEMIVLGVKPFVDAASTDVGKNFSREEFEVLPIERNYRSVASIVPHTSESYAGDGLNIAGASGIENRYFVNGNDVTDLFRGVGGTNLPYNFIKEIDVKIGGYEPEYRSSLGGIINAVTYSGGNEISGQAFGFFTNNNFGGEQKVLSTEVPKGAYAQYDYGISLGGPIVQDKLWFFGAYNPSCKKEDVKIPGLSYYPDQSNTQSFAGKLTWKASEPLDLALSLLGDPSHRTSVGSVFWGGYGTLDVLNPDSRLNDISTGGYSAMLDGRYVVNQDLLLQGSLSWSTRQDKYMPQTNAGWTQLNVYDYPLSTESGGYPERIDIMSENVSARLSASYVSGNHLIKAGIEYKNIILDCRQFKERWLSIWADSQYVLFDINQSGKFKNYLPSVYIQDSWSISNSLGLTGGVRWDGLFVIASNGELAARVVGLFEPRIGFTLMPGGDESQKIFASAGRYSEDLMTYGSTLQHNLGAYQNVVMYKIDPRLRSSAPDTMFSFGSAMKSWPGVQDLRGQYYDEVTLGYERLLAEDLKLTSRGIYRTLREVINDALIDPSISLGYYGNPGSGELSRFPKPRREYLALELTLEKSWSTKSNVMVSYVLSRNYGNFDGIYNGGSPNVGSEYDFVQTYDNNSVGLLSNDRTHIFKVNGSYKFDFGLSAALSFIWQSGTPLNETATRDFYTVYYVPRGSAGRLPSLWDLNLRLMYHLPFFAKDRIHPKLIIDVFHLGSQRTVVLQHQFHYQEFDAQGKPINPDPRYGMPLAFQPPMSVRVGMEVNF